MLFGPGSVAERRSFRGMPVPRTAVRPVVWQSRSLGLRAQGKSDEGKEVGDSGREGEPRHVGERAARGWRSAAVRTPCSVLGRTAAPPSRERDAPSPRFFASSGLSRIEVWLALSAGKLRNPPDRTHTLVLVWSLVISLPAKERTAFRLSFLSLAEAEGLQLLTGHLLRTGPSSELRAVNR